jgi:hypothetical protein
LWVVFCLLPGSCQVFGGFYLDSCNIKQRMVAVATILNFDICQFLIYLPTLMEIIKILQGKTKS